MSCSDCSAIEPIEDEGIVNLRPASLLISALVQKGYKFVGALEDGRLLYNSREELLSILEALEWHEKELAQPLSIYITGKSKIGVVERWVSLAQLALRFSNHKLIDIISNNEFSSHMQPIVNRSEEIVAFEFLLRPTPLGDYFQPYELFETARQTGFHSFLDRAARISAIETSARLLPKGIKRFVNFLPSSIYNPKYCLTHTFAAIERLAQDPKDFVFEVVETEKIRDISHLSKIFAEYRRQGMQVALDDVGTGFSTLDVMSSLEPDYVKIDRSLISYCDEDPEKQKTIQDIIERVGHYGGQVLAEGIERREEFLYCKELGVDLAQGYLFGKPEDKPPAHFGDCERENR
ncbi:EAL domain-containing protein [Paenibacillus wynnii]|uniref:Signal peptide protein n=1 Tax=Paenibacillus wynnii TaxID=268407 RepID=A0A098MAR9_9BACL|nr:EAL domain-containing protein [Paenibacillus wynnii]KGE19640.1 signal peptide protein [Paenibacillus wynnii]